MLVGYTEWPKEFADHYRDEGCWLGETFGGVLRERAEKYGDRIAVVSGKKHMTYSELESPSYVHQPIFALLNPQFVFQITFSLLLLN
ncbi:hypothetical protein BM86_02820, partial [Bacillus thuringiensis]|nr:hypothetical protein [Bacillus thuringiensis]